MAVGGDDDTIASSAQATASGPDLPELVANRYRIVRWLGGGGMGRVYEARDTELDERVALKVLRGGLAGDALERFRREVRLTRRIQHRNVARMFDIGEHGGDRFLTMELIDGAPLTRELGGAMAWPRLQALALQLCDGLAAAHGVGVVHRDLKPDNVLVEQATERAVITDFGIARSSDDASVTQVGDVVGTPRYMAPEQLAGRDVDARADLFSLGVMLYELASGARPWSGDNAIAIAVAQATQPPRPLVAPSLPAAGARAILRCLALDPADRPADAGELARLLAEAGPPGEAGAPRTDPRDPAAAGPAITPARAARPFTPPPRGPATVNLRGSSGSIPLPPVEPTRIPATARPAHETAIAVLPFTCAPGDEYLADGVLEDLLDMLSTTPSLHVRPAGFARARVADVRELGRQLAVDHVVVGALRRIPTGLRLSARLIGVADGFQIWSRRVDCAEAEVLSASEDLGRDIAAALSTRATAQTRPTDPRAVELYLRARAELRRFWGPHAKTAVALLAEAAAISPGSVPIAGALASASVQAWVMDGDGEAHERARLALERGLALDAPEAYLASASFRFNSGDDLGAAADLGTALVRAPMLAQAHEVAGRILVEVGELKEARGHFHTAAALDPTRAHILSTDLARLDALDGHWDRADRAVAQLLADPDPSIAQLGGMFQGRFATWRGDRAAMIEGTARFAPRLGPHARLLVDLVNRAVATGVVDHAAWPSLLEAFRQPGRPRRSQLIGLQMLAEAALAFGAEATALDTLELADTMGLLDVVVLDRCPLFAPLATSPRFAAVRARVAARAAAVLAAFRSTAG